MNFNRRHSNASKSFIKRTLKVQRIINFYSLQVNSMQSVFYLMFYFIQHYVLNIENGSCFFLINIAVYLDICSIASAVVTDILKKILQQSVNINAKFSNIRGICKTQAGYSIASVVLICRLKLFLALKFQPILTFPGTHLHTGSLHSFFVAAAFDKSGSN